MVVPARGLEAVLALLVGEAHGLTERAFVAQGGQLVGDGLGCADRGLDLGVLALLGFLGLDRVAQVDPPGVVL